METTIRHRLIKVIATKVVVAAAVVMAAEAAAEALIHLNQVR
jgi:hypothetical protein